MTKAHIGLVTIASILVVSTATLVLFGNSDKKITTAPPANKNMIAEKSDDENFAPAKSISIDTQKTANVSKEQMEPTNADNKAQTITRTDITLRKNIVEQWTNLDAISDKALEEALQQKELWDFDQNTDLNTLPLDDMEKNDGRKFLSVNPVKISTLIPGDKLNVPVPDKNEIYELVVENIGKGLNGLVTISGAVSDDPSSSFNIVRGTRVTSGHINTASNTYSFEFFGNQGWVHESGALFTEEHPPLIPPGEEGAPNTHVEHPVVVLQEPRTTQPPGNSDQ